jgi:hypothetical protein
MMDVRHFYLWTLALLAAVSLLCPKGLAAAGIGQVVQLEGPVDILRGGKLPAIPLKLQDSIDPGDVIRTKTGGKVQLKFIDDTTMTVAPGSRVAVESYLYDPGQGQRNAVLQVFMGLVETTVTKILKPDREDFILKTNTAVMGVRGTQWYTRLFPTGTEIYTENSKLAVRNLFPEVKGEVILKAREFTFVGANLTPTVPTSYDPGMLKAVKAQFTFLRGGGGGGGGGPAGGGGTAGGGSSASGSGSSGQYLSSSSANPQGIGGGSTLASQGALSTGTAGNPLNQGIQGQNPGTSVYIPPPALPPSPPPPPPPPPPVNPAVMLPFYIQTVWGLGGKDLDLHLTGPQGTSTFHVYYPAANQGSLTSQPFAQLKGDCIAYGGSEVIAVAKLNQGGVYQASVYNYGNQSTTSTNLSTTSGVSLQVIQGGTVIDRTPTGSYTTTGHIVSGGTVVTTVTPTSGQAGNTWQAVQINPANGQVTKVNQVVNSANSASVR